MWASVGHTALATCLILLCLATLADSHVRKAKDGSRRCRCSKRAYAKQMREVRKITVEDCGSEDSIIRTTAVNVYPHPVVIPGTVFTTFAFNLTADLPQKMQLDVAMHKYVFGIPFTLPCISSTNQWTRKGKTKEYSFSLGSCSYKDVCSIFQTARCPLAMKNSGIPCDCSKLTKGEYSLNFPMGITVPQFEQLFNILLKGQYMMKLEFVDQVNMRQIGCLKAYWEMGKYSVKRRKNWFYVE